jgi:CBS domain-containing protein
MDQVVLISSDQTVSNAVDKMVQTGAWSLLVEREELPVGVITDHDILRRSATMGRIIGRVTNVGLSRNLLDALIALGDVKQPV